MTEQSGALKYSLIYIEREPSNGEMEVKYFGGLTKDSRQPFRLVIYE
jgi:hypothetical protein